VDPNAGTNLAYPVAPAVSANDAVPDSAFTARDIAERTLDGALLAPTGHAELLKIVGKRDDHATTPTTWTFFFYDAGAAGHARIVTVSGGKVVKSGEDLVDFASPYTERMILPEEKVQKDSTDALQIAQTLAPSAKLTGSELSLVQQKYSVPMWRVTLWAREGDDERKLGDVTLLAENGTVIKRDLKDVRPANSRWSACWMSRSVAVSTLAVASSSTSTGGFFSSARAIETRCFSPTESFTPRSPTCVS
jgi:hypothetical protein